tara:strand:+ start:37113 stop:38087 length:975 start_codon:yes stop_codon:yes gene_type:complete
LPEEQSPKVAAILTCYNEGPYIGAAVDSILAQTRADLIQDIVIADDGSKEDTLAVLRELETKDSRIKVIYGPGGNGISRQRNIAVSSTSAPYLAFLDGDDLWHEKRLEIQLPIIESDDTIGLIYSAFHTFSDGDLASARIANVIDLSGSQNLTIDYFLNDPPIIPSAMIVRRSNFEAIEGFDETVAVFEDTDFFIRMSRVCRFGFVSDSLVFKRVWSDSITSGRTDLMAHHALVALKAASVQPELYGLVSKRLSERARKLANMRFLLGDREFAQIFSSLALGFQPFSIGNVTAWALARLPDAAGEFLRQKVFHKKIAAVKIGQG